MSEVIITETVGEHPQLADTTGEPLLDMYAMSWLLVFNDAASGNVYAQQDIIWFFGLRRALQLYQQQCIPWNPLTTYVQWGLFSEEVG